MLPKCSISEIVRGGAAPVLIPPTSFQRQICVTEVQGGDKSQVQSGLADSKPATVYDFSRWLLCLCSSSPNARKELSSCVIIKLSSCDYKIEWFFLEHVHMRCELRNQHCVKMQHEFSGFRTAT